MSPSNQNIHLAQLKQPVTVKSRNQSADEILSDLIFIKKELNAIGNNFNQSVKKMHTLDTVPELKAWVSQYDADRH